jgi:hypothetical protein
MNNFKIEKSVLKVMGCCLALVLLASFAYSGEESYQPGIVLIEFSPGVTPVSESLVGIQGLDEILQSYGVQSVTLALKYCPFPEFNWWTMSFPETAPVKEIMEKIRDLEGIKTVQLSYIYYPTSLPNDACYANQWNLDDPVNNADIDAPEGWQSFVGLPGSPVITVAVLDTGITSSHSEFAGRLVGGVDTTIETDGNYEDYCSNHHGTRMAGFIGANWNSSSSSEIAGIDAQCKIMPVQVCLGSGLCGCTTNAVADGICWAAINGADVISMSIGCVDGATTQCPTSCPNGDSEDQAVQYAYGLHVAIIAGSSNEGVGKADVSAPGCYSNVITVGATDHTLIRSHWDAYAGLMQSGTGTALDVMAPAGSGCDSSAIWIPSVVVGAALSCDGGPADISSCHEFTGTSSATPQLAGVASLMLAKNGSLLPDDIACLLRASAIDAGGPTSGAADDIDSPGRDDNYGWGRLNMFNAFDCIASPTPGAPALSQPIDDATDQGDQSFSVDLEWAEASCAETYDIHLAMNNPNPPIVDASAARVYHAAYLDPGQTYYWAITAHGCLGAPPVPSTAVHSFTVKDGPKIVLTSYSAPVEMGGDHDAYLESGEIWRLDVTLKNEGTMEALAVTATLDADVATNTMEPLIYYNATADFGPIPVGQTATRSYIFRIDPAAWDGTPFKCGDIMHLNLVSKSATAGDYSFNYPDDLDFYEPPEGLPVGLSSERNQAYAPAISSFSNGSRTTVFSPDFNINDDPPGLISIAGQLSIPLRGSFGESLTTCAKIELMHEGQVLSPPVKDYGAAISTSYNITSYYQTHLAGTYSAIVSECASSTECGSSSCTGSIYTVLGSMTVTKDYTDMCETYDASIAVTPAQGTAAGGTWVDVYGPPGTFESDLTADRVKFGFNNACPVSNTLDTEAVQFVGDDRNHIRVLTPIASVEAPAALNVDNPTLLDQCLPSAYTYRTLAYTANQVTQNISVVDTMDNRLFAPKESMDMGPDVVPMSMVYNEGDHPKPARRLYLVDYASGNLEYYDASNFTKMGTVALQAGPLEWPGAYDIAFSRSGDTAFVTHITDGTGVMCENVQPCAGGISVLSIAVDGTPTLIDADLSAPATPGAPAGITRLPVPSALTELGERFYPLSARTVMITDNVGTYTYRDKERKPGEYIFLSGVGAFIWHSPPGGPPICPPKQPCYPQWIPRRAVVAVIDNNKCLHCDPAVWGQPYCDAMDSADEDGDGDTEELLACLPGNTHYNETYWKNNKAAVWEMGTTLDGWGLGDTAQALGFSLTSNLPPPGSEPLGPTVYMLNKTTREMYLFNYNKDKDIQPWQIVLVDPANPENSYPFTIPTGPDPTDVKVQKVGAFRYAYITNAGDDTVTVVNTATNAETLGSPIPIDSCEIMDHFPTSIDARSTGDIGYSSDFHSNTVSVFNLPNPTQLPDPCYISVGEAPIRIVVQPVPGGESSFAQVRNELAFAQPGDFTTPSKQDNLIRHWEDVHQLQETSAIPQAVISNINAFQTKVNNWITDEALKKNVNEGVNLYRSAYIYNHPTLRQ